MASRPVVGDVYELIEKIGKGAFGFVFLANNLVSGEFVAVKIEKRGSSTLASEVDICQALKDGEGFPRVEWFGVEHDQSIMAMTLLGPSLKQLSARSGFKFSIKSIIQIVIQTISRLQYMHGKGFIHRDVKPGNLLVGLGPQSHIIYLVDFGMAMQCHPGVPSSEDKKENLQVQSYVTGTPRYASTNAHYGKPLCRKDDMESMCYTYVTLLVGQLPWSAVKEGSILQRYTKICQMKHDFDFGAKYPEIPKEFSECLNFAKNKSFENPDDYAYLLNLFENLKRKLELPEDNLFDWTELVQGITTGTKTEEEKKDNRVGTKGEMGEKGDSEVATANKQVEGAHSPVKVGVKRQGSPLLAASKDKSPTSSPRKARDTQRSQDGSKSK